MTGQAFYSTGGPQANYTQHKNEATSSPDESNSTETSVDLTTVNVETTTASSVDGTSEDGVTTLAPVSLR